MKKSLSKLKKDMKKEIQWHIHCPHCGDLLKEIYKIPAFQFQEQTIFTCGQHFFARFKLSGDLKELKIDWGSETKK